MDSSLNSKFNVGDIVEEKFRIEALLGTGASGSVYRATHLVLGKQTALKVSSDIASTLNVQQVQNEARILTSIEHPNVASLYGFGTTNHRLYLAFQLIEGKTLAEVLKDKTRLSPAESWPIFVELAEAFSFIHGKHVLHRDIKPSNIMLTTAGTPVIIDFGIARHATPDQTGTSTLRVVGTPLYMAPEVCAGAKATVSSDIYAFGCVMYECLCGTTPFTGETAYSIMLEHMKRTLPNMPTFCEKMLSRCLAKAPKERYQSFDDLLKDLKEIDLSCSKPALDPKAKQTGRHLNLKSVCLGLVVTAITIALIYGIRIDQPKSLHAVLEEFNLNKERTGEKDLHNNLLHILKRDSSATIEDRASAYRLMSHLGTATPQQKLAYSLCAGVLLAEKPLPDGSAFAPLFDESITAEINSLSDVDFSAWLQAARAQLNAVEPRLFGRVQWLLEIHEMIKRCKDKPGRSLQLQRLAMDMGSKYPAAQKRLAHHTYFLDAFVTALIPQGKYEEAASRCLDYMTERMACNQIEDHARAFRDTADVFVSNAADNLSRKNELKPNTRKRLETEVATFQTFCATNAATDLEKLQWLDRLSDSYQNLGDVPKNHKTIATALELGARCNLTGDTYAHLLHKQCGILEAQGRRAEVLASLEKAYRLTKKNPSLGHASSAEFFGKALVEAGRQNEALPYFEEADALYAEVFKHSLPTDPNSLADVLTGSDWATVSMASLREKRGEFRQGLERIDWELQARKQRGLGPPPAVYKLQELRERIQRRLEQNEKSTARE